MPISKPSLLTLSLLAALACGVSERHAPNERSAASGEGKPWFEEVANARGLRFAHRSGHRTRFLLPEIMGGGAALFDMDNDGDLDAYVVQSGSVEDPSAKGDGDRLFRNRGDGSFDDVTEGSGAQTSGYGMGVAAGDYDNDGDIDLYVPILGRTRCSGTRTPGGSPTSRSRRAWRERDGAPARRSLTPMPTATSTCS